MAGELLTYGVVSGLLYGKTKLKKVKFGIYPALLGAMVSGRVVYGLIFQLLLLVSGQLKALTVGAAIITGVPGILIQFLLLPPVILALRYSHVDGSGVHQDDRRRDRGELQRGKIAGARGKERRADDGEQQKLGRLDAKEASVTHECKDREPEEGHHGAHGGHLRSGKAVGRERVDEQPRGAPHDACDNDK